MASPNPPPMGVAGVSGDAKRTLLTSWVIEYIGAQNNVEPSVIDAVFAANGGGAGGNAGDVDLRTALRLGCVTLTDLATVRCRSFWGQRGTKTTFFRIL